MKRILFLLMLCFSFVDAQEINQEELTNVNILYPDYKFSTDIYSYLNKNSALGVLNHVHNKNIGLYKKGLNLINTKYKWGSETPENGFDCSGLVRYIYSDVNLPRSSKEISQVGLKIPRENLLSGDLVFFNTLNRKFSHVGIYMGDGFFIHSPSKGQKVRVESIEKTYWRERFNGARRIVDF